MPTAQTPTRWVQMQPAADMPAGLGSDPGGAAGRQHPLVARLLAARGVVGDDAVRRFLQPKLTDLHTPASLPGAVQAARRLRQAVDDKQPIVIYGDYDVDGVTASAILYHTLSCAGARVQTYVPHRLDEGYGLNEDAIRSIVAAGGDGGTPLIVSVDCGITAVGPARVARELGADLIITDHHQFDPDALPDAHTRVHPSVGDPASAYPNPDLCGAGVAYKLAWHFALEYCGCCGEDGSPHGKLPEHYRVLMLDLLAFAALGTIADVVPLVGENRVLAAFGLTRIRHTQVAGLNALISASKLDGEKIDSYHVGFVLGPRLNACGRMGHAREAVELLTTAQGERAAELAEQLHHTNEERRATEKRIVEAAVGQVEAHGYAADDRRAIVVAGEGWHPGVVGIVASRLVDRYHRPAVVLGIDPTTGEAKGSARSVDGVDLHAALSACRHHLTRFGGHAMAAGLSLDACHVDALREDLVAEVNRRLDPSGLCPQIRIDAEVALADCQVPLFDELQRLAPFGRSNPKPRLLAQGLVLSRPAQRMGAGGKHLALQLRQGDASIRAVAWNRGELADDLPAGVKVDVVFQPSINTWQGRRSAEMHIVDLRVV